MRDSWGKLVLISAALIVASAVSARALRQRDSEGSRPDAGERGSELDIQVAKAQLLLIAPDGKKTGYDARLKKIYRGIDDSSYYEDALAAYDTGAVDMDTTQTIRVRHPRAGKYRLVVSAGELANAEEYEVRVKLYSSDGSGAGSIRIAGTVKRGTVKICELRISANPPGVAIADSVARPGHY